ncbi:hypothetical protein ACIGG5_33920 [Streptomyces sp. NPDC085463]|uniref:hypothetical protein n=1 Tax=Streptomyces sp. NPDC085463 TaxID=3365724 RepID=UPI0037CE0848
MRVAAYAVRNEAVSIGRAASCPASHAPSDAMVALVRMTTAELRPIVPFTTWFLT